MFFLQNLCVLWLKAEKPVGPNLLHLAAKLKYERLTEAAAAVQQSR